MWQRQRQIHLENAIIIIIISQHHHHHDCDSIVFECNVAEDYNNLLSSSFNLPPNLKLAPTSYKQSQKNDEDDLNLQKKERKGYFCVHIIFFTFFTWVNWKISFFESNQSEIQSTASWQSKKILLCKSSTFVSWVGPSQIDCFRGSWASVKSVFPSPSYYYWVGTVSPPHPNLPPLWAPHERCMLVLYILNSTPILSSDGTLWER